MTREKYIDIRNKNDHIQMMWEFATSKGYKGDLNSFSMALMMWSQRIGPDLVNEYVGNVINYYDIKYGVILVEKVENTEVIDPFGRTISNEQKTLIRII